MHARNNDLNQRISGLSQDRFKEQNSSVLQKIQAEIDHLEQLQRLQSLDIHFNDSLPDQTINFANTFPLHYSFIDKVNAIIQSDVYALLQLINPTRNDRIDLVLTLKHLANPTLNYPERISTQFKNIRAILNNPGILNPDAENQPTAKLIIQAQINGLANQLIQQFQLQQEIDCYFQPQQAQQWWNAQQEAERKELEDRFNRLSDEEKRKLFQDYQSYARRNNRPVRTYVYVGGYYNPYAYDPFFWYYSARCMSDLMYLSYLGVRGLAELSFKAAGVAGHGIAKSAISIGGGSSSNCCSGGGGGGGSSDGIVILAALALIAIILSGLVGFWYAGASTVNAMGNFFKKPLAAITEIAAIAGGLYIGFVKGALIGAALGSIVPGIGTAAGAVIGALFGAGITAGVGALIGKMTVNAARYVRDNIFNSTYTLSSQEVLALQAKRFSINKVNELLQTIKQEKQKLPVFWLNDKEQEVNAKWDALIANIKNGSIPQELELNGRMYYLKHNNILDFVQPQRGLSNHVIAGGLPDFRQPCYQPQLTAAPLPTVAATVPAYAPPAYTPPPQYAPQPGY